MPDHKPFVPTGTPPFRGQKLEPQERGIPRHVSIRPALMLACHTIAKSLGTSQSAIIEQAILYALENLPPDSIFNQPPQKAA